MRGLSTRRKALIGVGVLATAAVIAFLVLGDGDDADPSSPVGAVRGYYEASQANDCSTMVDLMSEDLLTSGAATTRDDFLPVCEGGLTEEGQRRMEELEFDFALVSESGDTATVEVTTTFRGDSLTSSVGAVREEGQWKVDSLG
jgi:hypothetical protein